MTVKINTQYYIYCVYSPLASFISVFLNCLSVNVICTINFADVHIYEHITNCYKNIIIES